MKIAVGNKNDCLLRKNLMKFFKVFFFSGRGLCLTHVGAPCCESWLKFEIEALRCGKKLELKKKCSGRGCPLVGRHVVNEPKVGCHFVNKLGIF